MSSGTIDHNLVASQFAKFCPKSLSIDDLRCDDKQFCKKKVSLRMADLKDDRIDSTEYIKPNPTIKIESDEKEDSGNSTIDNKFMFLLGPSTKKKERPSKLIYELPNMKKIQSPLKTGKPLTVVSLSSHNLFELAANPSGTEETSGVSVSGSNVTESILAA